MNRKYNLKLDLQFRCNNSIMKFNQFDNNTSDFFMKISSGGKSFDVEKALVVLAVIKPSGKVSSQFVEVENGLVYADLKANMKDEIGNYTAQAMLILEDERVVTNVISYEVEEDKIFSLLNDTVETTEEFTLLTDMLSRLSAIEISEEQRMINEAERILSEENRKIEEAKRVEAELIRQHEEADRAKYDATRESNENIRKQNESIRLANEANRIDEETKRVEEENKRKLAEEERNANYNFMTEDEERRRLEANAHKEAEVLRVQAETNRVNEEAKRRTTEQGRISVENTRVSNENTRETNEVARQDNETKRVEAETQRQNRYNSFIADAEANTSNFENYTNTAKVKEEERKSNELDRKSQEARRVSNEVERVSNENTRKANEKAREKNETSRQNIFENKVDEVDKKIIELNATKDNFVSSINTKVDTKISEIDNVKDNFVSSVNTKVDTKISELDTAKSDITNTVTNKIDEVENRFNALTSKQQQDAEVVDARDGETSLKARLDRDVERTNKELDKIKKLEESTVSTVTTESDFTTVEATSNGYFEDVKLEGKTLVNLSIYKGKTHEIAQGDWYNQISLCEKQFIKTNTDYTLMYDIEIVENTSSWKLGENTKFVVGEGRLGSIETHPTLNYIENNGVAYTLFSSKCFSSNIIKFNIKEWSNDSKVYFVFRPLMYNQLGEGERIKYTIKNVILLEGDHTQNPPSYFEGLKSVGQSATTSEDGADEIVVSSVNKVDLPFSEDILQNKSFNSNGNIIDSNDQNIAYYEVIGGTEYKIKNRSLRRVVFLKDNEFLNELILVDSTDIFTPPVNCNKIGFAYNKVENPVLYGANQSDKKRLLYYNNETQIWEKPILREWDSIEKHANGKYYYHVRSKEGDYIEGDESLNDCITDLTVSVKKLAEEKVYECTNIDLITYANETNYIVNCGAIVPKTTLKVHNNISNVVSLLQKKVSILESNITSYMITQNRLMLASRYNADTVSFKVDVATLRNSFEYDNDLYELILNNILVGKDNYNREYIENLIIFYWMDFVISDEMHSTLFEIIEEQHNPKVIEEETPLI